MTPKRPRQRNSPRNRSTPRPIERVVPLRTASELLPHDQDEEERRLLIDDSRMRDRRREVSDAVLPVRDVADPDMYGAGLSTSDDLLYAPEPEHDRGRDPARNDVKGRGEN
ncbi:MAG: hypothetical protein IT360_24745 [Gemmatimonadaceae bacterium]|nr:hypothetical protein [Gemmatimonadaceae bacterium]